MYLDMYCIGMIESVSFMLSGRLFFIKSGLNLNDS